MESDRELASAADENFVASFRTLAGHAAEGEFRSAPEVFAFATGLPIPLFNGCVVTGPVEADELDSALAWVQARANAYRVWVSEGLAAERAHLVRAPGIVAEARAYPGMTLHPLPDCPAPARGVTVTHVGTNGFDEFLGIVVSGGLPQDLALQLFSPGFVADPAVALFVGRLDGEPVGTAIAICSRTASGVYNVTTLERARRRGIGSALTWAAIEAGLAWGRDMIVLQSSAMAEPMYRAMGFRLVAPYAVFSAAAERRPLSK